MAIAALGSQYVIALDATNCGTGASLAREQVTAATKEAGLPAVGKAASSLRGKLGESLASIQKFDTPVTEATTSSLEALKAYAAADAMRNGVGEAESIPFFSALSSWTRILRWLMRDYRLSIATSAKRIEL